MKEAKLGADFALILRLDCVSVRGARFLLSSRRRAHGVLQVSEAMNREYQHKILPEIP